MSRILGAIHTALAFSVATGDMDYETLQKRIAKESGVEPGEAAERLSAVWNIVEAQTTHYLGKQGITPSDREAFWEFAQSHKGEMRDALERQVKGRDMGAWKSLADKFFASVPPTTQALQDAGFEVRGDMVKIQGDWTPILAAAKMGLI